MTQRGVAPGLLLAMPDMLDPNFARSVVLMIEHDERHSFGLVINRPAEASVYEVMESLDLEWRGSPEAHVWDGGPVIPESGWLLHSGDRGGDHPDAISLVSGVSLSASPEQLAAIASHPPERVRFLLGYAGWDGGQLESEMAAGAWLIAAATPELVFETPADHMWEAALHSIGVDPTTLVSAPGVH